MALAIVEALSEPGAQVNEDAWGHAGGAVWLLDGATGVAPAPLIESPSDAAWFAREVSQRLASAVAPERPTTEAVLHGLRGAAETASRICDLAAVPSWELPSACLVMARDVRGGLEFTNLGDSVVLWRGRGGVATRFGAADELGRLEESLHRVLDDALAAGHGRSAGLDRARALAHENRKLMNRPEGYWILDLSGEGLSQAQISACPEAGPVDLLLMTDGFSRLVEVYGAYDWDGLMNRALQAGLAALYDELRAIEAEDEDCIRHQRFKGRDDATAVLLAWTQPATVD